MKHIAYRVIHWTLVCLLAASKTSIGDRGLAHLNKIGALTNLSLYTTNVTDAGLDNITGMTQLTWLNLDNTND